MSFSFVNLERSASVHLRTLSICSDGADTQMQRFAINSRLKPYSGEALSSACAASEAPPPGAPPPGAAYAKYTHIVPITPAPNPAQRESHCPAGPGVDTAAMLAAARTVGAHHGRFKPRHVPTSPCNSVGADETVARPPRYSYRWSYELLPADNPAEAQGGWLGLRLGLGLGR